MSTEPLAPAVPPPDVVQTAADQRLGGFQRVLTKYRKPLFRPAEFVFRVFDFEDGIVYQGRDGVLHTYPWSQVRTVYIGSIRHYANSAYYRTTYGFTLILASGKRLGLNGVFRDPELRPHLIRTKPVDDEHELFTLISAVAAVVCEEQLPEAAAALERGATLAFADIEISRTGVQDAAGLIPWSEIDEVKVHQGMIRIKRAGRSRPLSDRSTAEIPNVQLLIRLAMTLHARQRR